jgi:hypothetical protein
VIMVHVYPDRRSVLRSSGPVVFIVSAYFRKAVIYW